jgi:hypothetical protein
MAGKFVDLKEAAQILGVTPEELVDMRSQGEIFGYRDGASWKFKIEEVDRVAGERSAAGKSGSGVFASGDEDFGDFLTTGGAAATGDNSDSSESVLVNEEALGGSAVNKQSTVIGRDLRGRRPEDSDLKLASEESLSGDSPRGSLSSKSPKNEAGSEADAGEFDLAVGEAALADSLTDIQIKPPHASDVLGDVQLVQPGSGTGVMGSGTSSGGMELDVAGSGVYGLTDDSLSLDADDDSISLDASDLKQGPGTGSDVTFAPGDSGINLRSPSDSGLSLDEEPLDLGGSGLDQLELPEDDDVIALEDEAAEAELPTQLRADEAFSLSPVEGGADDDSDSGSQVIALEDSSAFDQNAATMLNQGGPLLAEGAFTDAPMGGFDIAGLGATPGMMAGSAVGPAGQPYVTSAPAETPYSVANVLGLMGTAGILALSGMLMWDVMLNMWSFSEGTGISTSLMDFIVSATGLSK